MFHTLTQNISSFRSFLKTLSGQRKCTRSRFSGRSPGGRSVLVEALELRTLLAAQVITTANAPGTAVEPGNEFAFDVMYGTGTNPTLGAGDLQLALHYDSSKLQFVRLENVQTTGLLTSSFTSRAEAVDDSDSLTDQEVFVQWAALLPNWVPNTAQPLYTAVFRSLASFDSGQTQIGFNRFGTTFLATTPATLGEFQSTPLTIQARPAAALALTIAADSIDETDGTGATTATVTRNSNTTDALTVTLTSDDESEATVPNTVVIPAGESTSQPFSIDAIDDSIADGDQIVTITATASGHAVSSDVLSVLDNEVAALTVTINDTSINEGDGNAATTATVTRNTETTNELTVTLVSSDPGEAQVVQSVMIAAGATTSLPFSIDAIEDQVVDGTQTATITASAAAHDNGTGTLMITDNDTPPALSITPDGTTTTADPIVFTFQFTENVTGFDKADVAVTNGAAGTFTAVDGDTYTLAVSPTADGTVGVSVLAAAAQDAHGNATTAATASVTSDTSNPVLSITPDGETSTADPIVFTFQFTEPVTGFEKTDIAVTNGTAGTFTAVDGDTYTLAVSPTANGAVTVAVLAAAAQDSNGNDSTAATASVTSDTSNPVLSITPDGTTTTADPIVFTFQFTENVTGFDKADVAVTNGTAGTFTGVDGDTYTLAVSPTADGTVSVSVLAAAAQDDNGNSSTAASASVTSDTSNPVLSITPDGITTTADPIVFTFQFTESVTGFDISDVTVTNGTAGTFTAVDGDTYTLAVSPTADGEVTVAVAAAAAQDSNDNGNTAATASVTSDTSSPVLSITPDGTTSTADPIVFTFQFTEPVTGFDISDVTVTNGTAGTFTAVDGDTYTLAVSPTADGAVTVSVAAAAAQDSNGNNSTTASATVTSDTSNPVLSITPDGITTTADPIVFTFQFTESVTGFDISDVTVTNGTAGTFTAVDGDTYTLAVSPTADGEVTVAVAAAAAQDSNDNGNTAATASVTSDTSSPVLSITPDGTTSTADPIVFTFQFTEPVTGFDISDVTVTNGTAGTFTAVDGDTYTLAVSPTADGAVTVSVAAAAAQDSNGNNSTTASATVTSDTSNPVLSITPDGITTTADPIVFTFQFTESVTGFDISDVTVTNGTAGTFTAVDGDTYTLAVSPTADGEVTVAVAAAAAQDSNDNGNTAASANVTAVSEQIAAQVISTANAPDASVEAGTEFTFDVMYGTGTTPTLGAGDLQLALHYDSSKLQFVRLEDVQATGLLTSTFTSRAEAVDDSDPLTDQEVFVQWSALLPNWVPDTAQPLYTAVFRSLASFDSGQTELGFNRFGTTFLSTTPPVLGEFHSTPLIVIGGPAAKLTLTMAADSVSEADGTGATTATVTRNSDTTDALTVTLTSDDESEATVPNTVVIPAGETTSLPFNINAVDDQIVDGSQTVTITANATGYAIGTDTLFVTDNDTAGVTLSKAAVTVNESGTSETFTVVLDAQPTFDVVLAIIRSDDSEAGVSPSTLTFTPSDWNITQEVTITGVDDAIVDGSISSTVTLSVNDALSDDTYDAVPDTVISVTTVDNDTADITAPSVAELSPADAATGISSNTNLVITFDEPVAKGAGVIWVRFLSDGSPLAAFPVTDASVTVSGSTVTIVPPVGLISNADLYVEVPAGAFNDLAGNPFGGISGSATWGFSTRVKADLVATAFNVLSDQVLDGRTDVAFTVRNSGGVPAAAFDNRIVWSPNSILGDGDDVVVADTALRVSDLAAGASLTQTVSIQIDKAELYRHAVSSDAAGGPVGTVSVDVSHLFLVIDTNDAVDESDEANNSGLGKLIDSDDITYFPWDTDGNGTVTPSEALSAIHSVNTANAANDFDGNGIVTPLEALSVLQRIGYRRNGSVSDDSGADLYGASDAVSETHVESLTTQAEPQTAGVTIDAAGDSAGHTNSVHDDDTENDLFGAAETVSDTQGQPLPNADDQGPLDNSFADNVDWLSVI